VTPTANGHELVDERSARHRNPDIPAGPRTPALLLRDLDRVVNLLAVAWTEMTRANTTTSNDVNPQHFHHRPNPGTLPPGCTPCLAVRRRPYASPAITRSSRNSLIAWS